MNSELKLSDQPPYSWVGAVTLMADEAQEVLANLPAHVAIREALAAVLEEAQTRASEITKRQDRKPRLPLIARF